MITNKIENALFIVAHLLKVGQEVFREDGEPMGKITEQEEDEALGILYDLAEKADKYCWHDLRKNPNDLPKCNVLVEVKFETGNYNHGIYDYYDECFGYKNVSKKDLRSKVISWRYIEPFEGGE